MNCRRVGTHCSGGGGGSRSLFCLFLSNLTTGLQLCLTVSGGLGVSLALGFLRKTTVVLGRLGDVHSFLRGLGGGSSCQLKS